MNFPLVSVIIPVFNRNKMLGEAVSSVINQTFQNWELIIVDDASSDGTWEKALEFSSADNRIKVLRMKSHLGFPGAVRNRGTELACGKYLAFLDSDDWWLPEKLEVQMSFMTKEKYRISHTCEKWMRSGKEVSQAFRKHKREGDVFSYALEKCMIGPSTVVMEESLFKETGGFSESLEICEDYHLWLKITAYHEIGYIDKPLTVKQAGDWEQLSTKFGQIEIFHIKALEDLLERNFFVGTRLEESRKVFFKKCGIYASGCHKRGKVQEAMFFEKLAQKYV